jgi:hypothetical protein
VPSRKKVAVTADNFDALVKVANAEARRAREETESAQQEASSERVRREVVERKLANYELMDRIFLCFAKQRVAEDKEQIALGFDTAPHGEGYERALCKTVEQAIELIHDDFAAVADRLDVYTAEERDDLRSEREVMLRALGMDEHEWLRHGWKF